MLLILLLPLIGSALIGLTGLFYPAFRRQETLIGALGTAAVGIPFLILLLTFLRYEEPVVFDLGSWMKAGALDIRFTYRLDALSLLMGLIVNGVGALIHVYSIGYMRGDKGFYKFFTFLNLFIFAMNNLILGDNMVVMFLGWEGVGLCSYLLIGFWYQNMAYSRAAQKAFIANRIGDFAMLIAMFMVFQAVGSLSFGDINGQVAAMGSQTTLWIALLVFIAATGKSAQIPLFVWLPDAMAGPTPVSALIHAATMVTAGIYLVARMHPLFSAAPEVMMVMGIVAAVTAIVAALIAIAQNDIKKVLAYSTVSQLGFMFMALSAGAFSAAIFHVMTHAFFKACLFLGSGSVIHAMEHMHTVKDPQDIRYMGGLGKYLPSTSRTFWISTLAISGVPLFSGFFSKDEILSSVYFAGREHTVFYLIFLVGVVTAFLTAFYMTRLAYLTFNGESRFPKEKQPHESPAVMTLPLWVLAILASVGGFLGLPYLIGHGKFHWVNHWLSGATAETDVFAQYASTTAELSLILLSVGIALSGVSIAFRFYQKHGLAGDERLAQSLGGFFRLMQNKFYFDELYQRILIGPFEWLSRNAIRPIDEKIIDGAVNGTAGLVAQAGERLRRLQSGLLSNYVLIVAGGVVLILTYLVAGSG